MSILEDPRLPIYLCLAAGLYLIVVRGGRRARQNAEYLELSSAYLKRGAEHMQRAEDHMRLIEDKLDRLIELQAQSGS